MSWRVLPTFEPFLNRILDHADVDRKEWQELEQDIASRLDKAQELVTQTLQAKDILTDLLRDAKRGKE